MSEVKELLKVLDETILALKDARHHLKCYQLEQYSIDNDYAYRSFRKAVSHKDPDEQHCHHHRHHCRGHCCCRCCCHHPKPNPPSTISSKKFLAKASAGISANGRLIMFASSFVDDNGDPVSAFPSQFEFYSLYINGMIQLNSVVSVSPFLIAISGGDTLDPDDPILIEFVVS